MPTNAQLSSELTKLTVRVAATEKAIAALSGVPAPAPAPAPTPTPTPTPVPAPAPASPIDIGMAAAPPALPDVLASQITPYKVAPLDPWTEPAAIPGTGSPDVVGAFRLTAAVTHVSNADSLAFPGVARPRNHHHTYWGNPISDENTTYQSLIAAGVGSGEGGPLNRSTKWMPSLLTADRRVIIPDYITEYYKQLPSIAATKLLPLADQTNIAKHRPHLIDAAGKDTGRFADTVPLPAGLRFIVGNILPQDFSKDVLGNIVTFLLYTPAMAQIAESPRLGDLLAKMTEGTSYVISMLIQSPGGWDGKRVSASDHHSHMQYVRWSPLGYHYLPETHPFVVPAITIKPFWRITPECGDPKKLFLSSDILAPGDTMHFEYLEGWHRPTLEAWHAKCIDGFLNSSGGNLGDGRGLRRPPCFATTVARNVITPDANGFARLIDSMGNRL